MVKTIWKFWWLLGMILPLTALTTCAIGRQHWIIMVFVTVGLQALCFGLGELMDRWNVLNEGGL